MFNATSPIDYWAINYWNVFFCMACRRSSMSSGRGQRVLARRVAKTRRRRMWRSQQTCEKHFIAVVFLREILKTNVAGGTAYLCLKLYIVLHFNECLIRIKIYIHCKEGCARRLGTPGRPSVSVLRAHAKMIWCKEVLLLSLLLNLWNTAEHIFTSEWDIDSRPTASEKVVGINIMYLSYSVSL